MSAATDTDVKELKELLAQQFERLNDKIDKLASNVNALNLTTVRIETEFRGEFKRVEEKLNATQEKLETKIDGFGKRLEYQEFVGRGILIF
jgi:outer membrane murein-binding lipoprotein Lpp